jgi:hypothetical protein
MTTMSPEYHRAVARRIKNNRYAAALALAEVAEAHCRLTGATADDLAAMPHAHWLKLSALAGRTRPPSDDTKAETVKIVRSHLTPAYA